MTTPTEWEQSTEHPGYFVKVIQHNGCTIQILRPELSEHEREKRVAHIKKAAERVLRDYYKRKEKIS